MRSLSGDKADFLLLLARCVVPEVCELDERAITTMSDIIDHALEGRPPAVRKQFAAFLGVVRWAPLIRYGAVFDRLCPESQDAVLGWFEDCPIRLLRTGFWGLKSIVFMGYYGRPEAWSEVGYAPDFKGPAALDA